MRTIDEEIKESLKKAQEIFGDFKDGYAVQWVASDCFGRGIKRGVDKMVELLKQ